MSGPIKTMEEFIAWTERVEGRLFVYRGLADAAWEVEASGYRRIRESYQTPPPPPVFQNYIKQLLESAQLRRFQERQGKSYTDLELLADLQHYGAATCLIDFTTNALVALWVACEDRPQQPAGKVVAMATEDTDRFAIVTSQHLKQPIDTFLGQSKLWKWEPSHLSTRIVAQQSVFVFGTGTIDDTYYESIEIDGGSKGTIREALQERFGLTEQHLFSDFPGFALSHAHNKPYRDYTAEDYFSLGVMAQQQGDYEKAEKFYSRALEIDFQYSEARNNLETVKQLLAQVKAKREAEQEPIKQIMTLFEALATMEQRIASSEEIKALAAGVARIASSEQMRALTTGVARIASSEEFKALATGVARIASSEEFKALADGEALSAKLNTLAVIRRCRWRGRDAVSENQGLTD